MHYGIRPNKNSRFSDFSRSYERCNDLIMLSTNKRARFFFGFVVFSLCFINRTFSIEVTNLGFSAMGMTFSAHIFPLLKNSITITQCHSNGFYYKLSCDYTQPMSNALTVNINTDKHIALKWL